MIDYVNRSPRSKAMIWVSRHSDGLKALGLLVLIVLVGSLSM